MANTAVGLDIGSHTVHVCEVAGSRGGMPTLKNFGAQALPPDAVREGEILDVAAVSAAIKELMSATGIREKDVHLGVANQRVVVRQIDLPYMDETELRESLRFQVQEFIPIPVEDAELDFHPLEEYQGDNDTRMQRLLLVAAHKDMVATHVEAASAAGLHPKSVDLNPFAMLRALATERAVAGGQSEMLVDVGGGVTNIVVHDQGTPRFVRILVLGGDDITETLLAREGLSFEDAQQMKHQTGLGGEGQATGVIDERAGEFVDEVRSSLDYYLAQMGSSRIERVLLCGGGALLSGLLERLAGALRLPVELGRPFEALDVSGTSLSTEELALVEPTLCTAAGLAIGGLE